jgi:hypothetical protein
MVIRSRDFSVARRAGPLSRDDTPVEVPRGMPFPLDSAFVKRAQAKLGRKLPLGYVVRMCRENGGAVVTEIDVWSLFTIFDDSDKKRLTRTCNDIIRQTALARKRPDFPANAVAIGENGGGDILIFLADPDHDRYADAVYWWDNETGEVDKLADNFEELSELSGERD